MTNKEAIKILHSISDEYCQIANIRMTQAEDDICEALDMAIEAIDHIADFGKKADGDCISRQAAIDALKICDNNEDGINCHKCPLRDERWDGAWQDDE